MHLEVTLRVNGTAQALRVDDERRVVSCLTLIDVVSMHPGVVSTGLLHAMFGPGGEPATRAGSVLVDLCRRPLETGGYYDEDRIATPNPQALDHATQERLARYVLGAIGPFRKAPASGRQPGGARVAGEDGPQLAARSDL